MVHVSAVYYREIEDQAEKRARDEQDFKYAMLTGGVFPLEVLFPELITETDDSKEIENPDDGETIIYKFSEQPELTQEEIERELAMLMAGGDMTVNGDEFGDWDG